jgi:hypothetical protein
MKASLEMEGERDVARLPCAVSSTDSVTDIGDEPFLAAPMLEIDRGSVLAGRYQIERTIGKGGSGLVLRAFDRIAQQPSWPPTPTGSSASRASCAWPARSSTRTSAASSTSARPTATSS